MDNFSIKLIIFPHPEPEVGSPLAQKSVHAKNVSHFRLHHGNVFGQAVTRTPFPTPRLFNFTKNTGMKNYIAKKSI